MINKNKLIFIIPILMLFVISMPCEKANAQIGAIGGEIAGHFKQFIEGCKELGCKKYYDYASKAHKGKTFIEKLTDPKIPW